nr:type II toxin-antitoxin system VapC family toxin [Bacteroidota bacterium]
GIIDGQFSISVINKIEILGFSGLTEDEELKFNQFITAANVLNLDDAIVDTTIGLRKQFKTKLPDAIIAATALVNNLILFTRNTKDFDKIEGLVLNDPYCSSYRLLK